MRAAANAVWTINCNGGSDPSSVSVSFNGLTAISINTDGTAGVGGLQGAIDDVLGAGNCVLSSTADPIATNAALTFAFQGALTAQPISASITNFGSDTSTLALTTQGISAGPITWYYQTGSDFDTDTWSTNADGSGITGYVPDGGNGDTADANGNYLTIISLANKAGLTFADHTGSGAFLLGCSMGGPIQITCYFLVTSPFVLNAYSAAPITVASGNGDLEIQSGASLTGTNFVSVGSGASLVGDIGASFDGFPQNDGTGSVDIFGTVDVSQLRPGNILSGVSIGGIEGDAPTLPPLGSPGQVLAVNSDGTAAIWKNAPSGTPSICPVFLDTVAGGAQAALVATGVVPTAAPSLASTSKAVVVSMSASGHPPTAAPVLVSTVKRPVSTMACSGVPPTATVSLNSAVRPRSGLLVFPTTPPFIPVN